jgi:hypothetical protein
MIAPGQAVTNDLKGCLQGRPITELPRARQIAGVSALALCGACSFVCMSALHVYGWDANVSIIS